MFVYVGVRGRECVRGVKRREYVRGENKVEWCVSVNMNVNRYRKKTDVRARQFFPTPHPLGA